MRRRRNGVRSYFCPPWLAPNHAGSQVAKPNLQYVTSHRTASIEVALLGLRNP